MTRGRDPGRDRAFHDEWAKVGPAWLLCELGEEAGEVGAWSARTVQALDHGHGLDHEDRQELTDHLAAATRAGATAPQSKYVYGIRPDDDLGGGRR